MKEVKVSIIIPVYNTENILNNVLIRLLSKLLKIMRL